MSKLFTRYLRAWFTAGLAFVLSACSSPEQANEFIGYVEAELRYIAAGQAGWLTEQPWQAGQVVEPQQALFSLDDSLQVAQIKQAEAILEQAKAQERNTITGARQEELAELAAQQQAAKVAVELARSEQLRWTKIVAQGLAPQSKATQVNADYDASVAKLESIEASIEVAKLGSRQEIINSAYAAQQAAEAALEQAKWQLAQRHVVATLSGQIEEIFYREGEYVPAGQAVLAILPEDALIIRFFVPQAQLSNFALGQTVHINADGLSQPLSATLFHISRRAEFTPPVIYDQKTRDKLMFLIEARLTAQNNAKVAILRPGLPVTVSRL